jgi:hypothetical protein
MNAMDCSIVHAPTVEPGLHQMIRNKQALKGINLLEVV